MRKTDTTKSDTKKKKSNPHLVVQSNNFINYRHTLSLAEARVFLSMVAQIERDDQEFKTYKIEVHPFMESVGLKGKGGHTILKEVANGLLKKTFKRVSPDGSFEIIGYISYAKYVAGQSFMELSFDPRLKPYLLNIKEAFTQYDIRYIISLRSIHSVRIYELLKQHEWQGITEFDVDVLKTLLNIEDKYQRYRDFKSNVLEQAKRDLSEQTDISFEYEEIRSGRIVTRLRFHIINKNGTSSNAKKPPEIHLPIDIPNIIIVQTLPDRLLALCQEIEPSITEEEIQTFIGEQSINLSRIMDVLYYAKEEKAKGIKIKSLLAYLKSGLQNNLGKGLSDKYDNIEHLTAEKKRKTQENREISEWEKNEFPEHLSDYYQQLGVMAEPSVKNKYFEFINHEIANTPSLRHVYYHADGQVNKEQFQIALGQQLSSEQGETSASLFVKWCLEIKGTKVTRDGTRWFKEYDKPEIPDLLIEETPF